MTPQNWIIVKKKHIHQDVFMGCSTSAWRTVPIIGAQATGLYRTTRLIYFWYGAHSVPLYCIAKIINYLIQFCFSIFTKHSGLHLKKKKKAQ